MEKDKERGRGKERGEGEGWRELTSFIQRVGDEEVKIGRLCLAFVSVWEWLST